VTIYRRPSKPVQWMNGFMSWLASKGIGPSRMITLEVKGRRSGHVRSTVVNVVEYEGEQYLVSPRGESEWVRNVRAAGGEAVIRHGGRQKVKLLEIIAAERAPIIKKYLKENTLSTKAHFGIEPDAPLEGFQRIAERHPVFRIIPGER